MARSMSGRGSTAREGEGGGAAGTMTVAVACALPLDAVIMAAPERSALTSPSAETVAVWGSLDCHATGLPPSTAPERSRVVAVSCADPPAGTVIRLGTTLKVAPADSGFTPTVAVAVFPSTVRSIRALPTATAKATPSFEILATVESVVLQRGGRPPSSLPN